MSTELTKPSLERRVGLGNAISLNMINMIGVGPFITLPLVIGAMGGPQAMLGWILGALIAVCDGLVWAELGAAMPEAGGSYAFLREIYGRDGAGRYASFLYIWQLSFSAPLSIASGCIGFAQYAFFLFPQLGSAVISGHSLRYTSLVAAAVCIFVVALLYRNLKQITRLGWVLWGGVLLTINAVIFAGFSHFHPALLHLAPHAFSPGVAFFQGLGSATLIATYDYWGYYAVCFIGGEVRQPGKTIPRAVLFSIAIVATLYLAMNISVLGVIPTHEMGSLAVVAQLMQRTWGARAAMVMSALVMWTALASVFSLLLAYSRVPYAAALDGNYFRIFARLHPRHKIPHLSLLVLGAVSAVFCLFDLASVIAALVVIRIVLQYVLQQVGVILLRLRKPEMPRPFKMWLYPLPPLLALCGFIFILFSRHNALREFSYAIAVAAAGTVVYMWRAIPRREWPFGRR